MLSRINIFRKSLLTQLISSFSLLSLVTVSLVAYSAHVQARHALEESVYERLKVAVALREYELNQWFESQRQEAILLARSPIILDSIEALLTVGEEERKKASIKALQDYFDLVLEVKNPIQGIEVLNNGGIVVLSTNLDQVGIYMGLGNTTTYFEPGQTKVVPNIYFSSITGKPTIRFATPINQGGERKAVLAITLNLEAVNRIIRQKTGLGETGETFLVKELAMRNVFVSDAQAATDQLDRELSSHGINRAIQGQDGQGMYRNHENVPVVGVYHWLENSNVALLAELYQKEAFKPAVNLARGIFLIGVGAIGILLILVRWLARHIARPVLTITNAAEAIQNDQFEVSMLDPVLNRPDEIGQLAQVFKQMADQVFAREAQLKAQIKAGGQQASGLELAYYEALRKKSAWLRQHSPQQTLSKEASITAEK